MEAGRDWVLLGAGGHASSMAAVIAGRGDVVAGVSGAASVRFDGEQFADDDAVLRWAVSHGAAVAIAVGDPALRATLLATARAAGADLLPLVAASAVVSRGADLGDGVNVGELAMLGPGSVVGPAAIVNTGAIVEHGVRVGAATHLAPRSVLLGDVTVGERCLIGAGAIVLLGRTVGDGATVGAGAVVTKDVPPGATVVGVPGRVVPSPDGRNREEFR